MNDTQRKLCDLMVYDVITEDEMIELTADITENSPSIVAEMLGKELGPGELKGELKRQIANHDLKVCFIEIIAEYVDRKIEWDPETYSALTAYLNKDEVVS